MASRLLSIGRRAEMAAPAEISIFIEVACACAGSCATTGGNCSPTIAYQTLGAGGTLSKTPQAGMVSIKAVQCYIRS